MNKKLIMIVISFLISGCCFPEEDPRVKTWRDCDRTIHPIPEEGSFVSRYMGDVIMIDGEKCSLEEVGRVYSNCYSKENARAINRYEFDDALQCKYCRAWTSPVARRMICKSGKYCNSITYDGTKFHREIIQ